ncbi:hypothetical protein K2173_002872 [Erythroxylum novogranatense]|uniref:RING-type domain-containing protein n=1 Tax=Erythroxylum novogranatense TaxID=1862640 RepID=A0AAV8SQ70_9ROSI|nr:hypothetical protein K2173_002872 [Erythroxylum novogranatense]
MGCTARDKHVRANRKVRSTRPEFEPCCYASSISKSVLQSGLKPFAYNTGLLDPNHNNSSGNIDENGWGYCTEEQLEEVLLKNLEFLYKEAIDKLVSLGYDEDTALQAILRNGHCYGGMDVLTNILHNSLAYLNNNSGSSDGYSDETELTFSDLRQLEEYSLASMICLLQQVRPHLSKGDAMWCLLMSDLHVNKATTIEIPTPNAPGVGYSPAQNSVDNVGGNVVDNGVGVIAPALSRFHGGWGFGNGSGSEFAVNGFLSYSPDLSLPKDVECPKRFNLSPSMKSLLKRNVAMFAAGFRANSTQIQIQSQAPLQACVSGLSGSAASVVNGGGIPVDKCEDSQNLKNQDGVSSVLSKFRDLNLEENLEVAGEDQKDEMIMNLVHQVKDLERQLKDRKEWAHEKAVHAAKRLSNDLTELKILRIEREEIQRLKKGKPTLDDSTMKRLTEMENALRKASSQVDRANAAVRRLETENAEIRAEMEASKLSASESVTTCLEVARREKKCLKKLLAWEKQKTKLQDEIADEKEKIKELQRCLEIVQQAQEDAEVMWREEVKARDQALTRVEEERFSKEAAEASNKRKLETLRLKIEIDSQRYKDDVQRLEQELLRLKSSAELSELNLESLGMPERTMPRGETIAKLLHELDKLEASSDRGASSNRECIICAKEEVSVVFLPCAHQVLCANCSDNYGKKGKASCPSCRVPIVQRIRVFGACS